MRCREFERWLDEGMPQRRGAAARAHAEGCAGCAAAMRAAAALETALAAAPPPAPAALVARVMERVERVERARGKVIEAERAGGRVVGLGRSPRWTGWAAALAQEPGAAVGIALAPVVLILWLAWPETATALIQLTRDAVMVWLTTVSSGTLAAATGLSNVAPQGRAAFDALLMPAMVAAGLGSLVWLGVVFRPVRSLRARKPPRA